MAELPTVRNVIAVSESVERDTIKIALGVGGTSGFEVEMTREASQQVIAALAASSGRLERGLDENNSTAATITAEDAILAKLEDGSLALNVILAGGASLVFSLPPVSLASLFSSLDAVKKQLAN